MSYRAPVSGARKARMWATSSFMAASSIACRGKGKGQSFVAALAQAA